MKKLLLSTILITSCAIVLHADSNNEQAQRTKKQVQAQMQKEKVYAREQAFYQSKDYNLSAVEVDPKSLKFIEALEPQYDFDMDDVYSDIQ